MNHYIIFSCDKNAKQKCSRLIFIWTHGGRGINFLDGQGISLRVSTSVYDVQYIDVCRRAA